VFALWTLKCLFLHSSSCFPLRHTSKSQTCRISHLLAPLENGFRERSILFDFRIVVGGECIPCHRCVLAACSDFFRYGAVSQPPVPAWHGPSPLSCPRMSRGDRIGWQPVE
uniref:BTB domain-containing protein n=1 Tax=Paramormyrops kingsleyae TaxID=1676925 RepID=A0A3B3RM82_9TELE